MRTLALAVMLAAGSLASTASHVSAQPAPLVADLIKDVDGVAQKFIGLAKATPADKFAWRPGTGVRSAGEVFLHVASDNYLIPAGFGNAIPASTKIDAKDMKTLATFEQQNLTPAQIVTILEESFAHLKASMTKTTVADLTKPVSMFGMSTSAQSMWILATTHLHEHLGQSIAYARTNGIVPPWSK